MEAYWVAGGVKLHLTTAQAPSSYSKSCPRNTNCHASFLLPFKLTPSFLKNLLIRSWFLVKVADGGLNKISLW